MSSDNDSDSSSSSDDAFTFQKHSYGGPQRRKRSYSDSSSSRNSDKPAESTGKQVIKLAADHIDKKQEIDNNKCIELSSDDDDDSSIEENDIEIKRVAMEKNEGYRRALEAMEALKKAHVNKASIDILSIGDSSCSITSIEPNDEYGDDPEIMLVMDGAVASSSKSSSIIITTIINGESSTSRDWQLKCTDPFSKLIQIFEKKYPSLDVDKIMWPQKNSQVFFEHTPLMLYMPNKVTLNLILDSSSRAANNNLLSSTAISLKLRINGDDKQVQSFFLQPTDPFSKLLQSFLEQNKHFSPNKVILMLDGASLPLHSTPQGEDLEGDEIIEVNVK